MLVSSNQFKIYLKNSFVPRPVSQVLQRTFSLHQHKFKMPQEIHKYGTNDGWHGIIQEGGEFPPEKDRYHLYIGTSRNPSPTKYKLTHFPHV